jgi:transcriptional regulator with XRE-family HTH domain
MARDGTRSPAIAFWERVERAKLNLGWNDTELARRAGIDRSVYLRLPKLKKSPSPSTVQKLADAVGIDRTEAFTLAGLLHAETPTEPHAILDVEGDLETEALLARLPQKRREFLERVRESEQRHLAKLQQLANERFADRVRLEADEAEKREM